MTLLDPLDVAATHDWPAFMDPLVKRTIAARKRNEPVHMTKAEQDELNRRSKTQPTNGELPLTFFGWPVIIDSADTAD